MKPTLKEYQNIKTLSKPYINRNNWERIDFPAEPKDWKKFERNNKKIALNILFKPPNTKKKISAAYRSEYNSKHKKQVILLMITNGKISYYLVTNLSAFFQGMSSNLDRDFYCLNCFNSYCTENKLKEHEEICNKNENCCIIMSRWAEKILKYNLGEKT